MQQKTWSKTLHIAAHELADLLDAADDADIAWYRLASGLGVPALSDPLTRRNALGRQLDMALAQEALAEAVFECFLSVLTHEEVALIHQLAFSGETLVNDDVKALSLLVRRRTLGAFGSQTGVGLLLEAYFVATKLN